MTNSRGFAPHQGKARLCLYVILVSFDGKLPCYDLPYGEIIEESDVCIDMDIDERNF